MSVVLPMAALRERIDARGLHIDNAKACAAALQAGRHLILTSPNPERALACAEAFASVAVEAGLALGALTLSGNAARLLTLNEVVSDAFKDDFWLIVSRADADAVERTATYIVHRRPSEHWRAVVVTSCSPRRLLGERMLRSGRLFAVFEIS